MWPLADRSWLRADCMPCMATSSCCLEASVVRRGCGGAACGEGDGCGDGASRRADSAGCGHGSAWPSHLVPVSATATASGSTRPSRAHVCPIFSVALERSTRKGSTCRCAKTRSIERCGSSTNAL